MQSYTLFLNLYEFIDKIPEKLQGENRAKIAQNACLFFVDGISGSAGRRGKAKYGEKARTVFGIIIFFTVYKARQVKCRFFENRQSAPFGALCLV